MTEDNLTMIGEVIGEDLIKIIKEAKKDYLYLPHGMGYKVLQKVKEVE